MLGSFQEAIVALATDPAWRARRRTEGVAFLDAFPLDAAERQALAAIPIEALERYARSLVAKRWQEVLRTTPLTARVVPELVRMYRQWAEERPLRAKDGVLPPGPADALEALGDLRRALSSPRFPEYAAELLAFEVLGACSRVEGGERFLASRWNLADIAADIERGLLPVDPDERATMFSFDGSGVRWRARP